MNLQQKLDKKLRIYNLNTSTFDNLWDMFYTHFIDNKGSINHNKLRKEIFIILNKHNKRLKSLS